MKIRNLFDSPPHPETQVGYHRDESAFGLFSVAVRYLGLHPHRHHGVVIENSLVTVGPQVLKMTSESCRGDSIPRGSLVEVILV